MYGIWTRHRYIVPRPATFAAALLCPIPRLDTRTGQFGNSGPLDRPAGQALSRHDDQSSIHWAANTARRAGTLRLASSDGMSAPRAIAGGVLGRAAGSQPGGEAGPGLEAEPLPGAEPVLSD
jgi:hypothetical protein